MNKELAEKMLNPYYITDRSLQVRFNINLDSHQISHANPIITFKTTYSETGIEILYFNEILRQMAAIYAGLINQQKYNYETLFSS